MVVVLSAVVPSVLVIVAIVLVIVITLTVALPRSDHTGGDDGHQSDQDAGLC
jgi:hypothetical protein